MASLFTGATAGGRCFRTVLPGPGASQRLNAGHQLHDSASARSPSARFPTCRAERSSSINWGPVVSEALNFVRELQDELQTPTGGGTYSSPKWRSYQRGNRGPADAAAQEADLAAEERIWCPVDVEEHADGYSLWMDVPGLQKSDIKVQVFPQQRTITISGERRRAAPESSWDIDGRAFRRRYERKVGSFSRSLRLAKDLDATTINARVDKGVLHITAKKIPAVEPAAAESVEIKIEQGI